MSVTAPTPDVPTIWKVISVGEVCEVQNGFAFKSTYFNHSEGLPIIRIRDVHSGRSDTRYSGFYDDKYIVNDDDLLVGMDGEFRVRKWRSGIGLLNQRVCRIIPNGGQIIADFLYYSIRRPLKQIEDFTPYTTVKHISARQIRDIEIPLPPLFEQKKIAHILSSVQEAIETQERIIQTTTELKKALMQKLFTEGLRREPQKQTEIGLVPESWEVKKIGEIATLKSGGTPSRKKPEYWKGGDIPWVKTCEVDYCTVHETEEKITKAGLDGSSAKLFPAGTLLMAMYGQGITRGKVALLGLEASTNQACVAFFPNQEVDSKYLYYYFEYSYDDIRNFAHGANQKNLSANIIKTFPVSYPSDKKEQKEIAGALEKLDTKKHIHLKKKKAYQDLFRTLLHELMTVKIRVHKLDLSNPG